MRTEGMEKYVQTTSEASHITEEGMKKYAQMTIEAPHITAET
jgi:hypothetical protein